MNISFQDELQLFSEELCRYSEGTEKVQSTIKRSSIPTTYRY